MILPSNWPVLTLALGLALVAAYLIADFVARLAHSILHAIIEDHDVDKSFVDRPRRVVRVVVFLVTAAALASPALKLAGDRTQFGGNPEAVFLQGMMARAVANQADHHICLGYVEGTPYFAVDVTGKDVPLKDMGEFVDLRQVGALLFAFRDNLVRHFSLDTDVPATTAGAATMASAIAVTVVFVALRHESLRATPAAVARWLLPGAFIGLSYICLFEAFYRGTVSVVAPIVGTEALFGVAFSALFLHRTERVGLRLVLGATLVVAGAVLIGTFR